MIDTQRICYGCFESKEPGQICPYCGFDDTKEQPYLALPLGTILGGRYITGRVLGIGGFGITYLGLDLTLELKVAIKEYMPSAMATRGADKYNITLTSGDEETYRAGEDKFLSEARILAKLQNAPNIVSVQNYFRENNTAYFVMEYIEGMSLKDYLQKKGGTLDYAQTLTILKPIMEALIRVHEKNLVHRDVSPDNIYITSEGESRLLDFGAARSSVSGQKSVSVILKHGYAPEEQYSSHGAQGPWTDVYAMGATFYRCVTGKVPPDAIERNHEDRLEKPSALGAVMPKEAEEALLKALAVRTQDRFPDMRSFINALTGAPPMAQPVEEKIAKSISQKTSEALGTTAQIGRTVYGAEPSPGTDAQENFFIKLWKKNRAAVIAAAAVLLAACIAIPVGIVHANKVSVRTELGPVSTGSAGRSTGDEIVDFEPEPGSGDDTEDTGGKEIEATPSPAATAASSVETRAWEEANGAYSLSLPETYEIKEQDDGSVLFSKPGAQASLLVVFQEYFMGGYFAFYDVWDFAEVSDATFELLGGQSGAASGEIIGQQEAQIDGRDSYMYLYDWVMEAGNEEQGIVAAVDGREDHGVWLLCARWQKGDETSAAELASMIDTFHVQGNTETLFSIAQSEHADFRFMYRNDLVAGVLTSEESDTENPAITPYVDANDTWSRVVVENGSKFGDTEEEAFAWLKQVLDSGYPGATQTDSATLRRQDSKSTWSGCAFSATDNGKNVAFYLFTTTLEDKIYVIFAASDEAHHDKVELLIDEVMNSLDPIS